MKILIVEFDHPHHFFGKVLEDSNFIKLKRQISDYSKSQNFLPLIDCSSGMRCLAYSKKNLDYKRAMIKEVVGSSFKCYFVDEMQEVWTDRVYSSLDWMWKLPSQIKCFALTGIIQSGQNGFGKRELNWNLNVISFAHQMISKANFFADVKVVSENGNVLWVQLYLQNTQTSLNELLQAEVTCCKTSESRPEYDLSKNICKLPAESSTTKLPNAFDKKIQTSPDEEKPIIQGNVKASRCFSIQDQRIPPFVTSSLIKINQHQPTLTQSYCWPIIMKGLNLFVNFPWSIESILTYVVPLLSRISLYDETTNEGCFERKLSPQILVFCVSSWSVKFVADVFHKFLPSKYFVSFTNQQETDHTVLCTLQKDCKVLISTPYYLLRNRSLISLNRICHLVYDDADIIMRDFSDELDELINIFNDLVRKPQILIFTSTSNTEATDYKILLNDQACVRYYKPVASINETVTSVDDPICLYTLSFGFCRKNNLCKRRHYLSLLDTANSNKKYVQIPETGHIKIFVTKIKHASLFFGRLVKYINHQTKQVKDYTIEYGTLTEKLAYYQKNPNKLSSNPKKGDFVAAQISNILYRSKIVACDNQKLLIAGQMVKYQVHLVDVGTTSVVTSNCLFILPDSMQELPFQAVKVHVLGIKPAGKDDEWSLEANQLVHENICEQMIEGNINHVVRNWIWLSMCVKRSKIPRTNIMRTHFNLCKELICRKLASSSSDHIALLKKEVVGDHLSKAVVGDQSSQAVVGDQSSKAEIGDQSSKAVVGKQSSLSPRSKPWVNPIILTTSEDCGFLLPLCARANVLEDTDQRIKEIQKIYACSKGAGILASARDIRALYSLFLLLKDEFEKSLIIGSFIHLISFNMDIWEDICCSLIISRSLKSSTRSWRLICSTLHLASFFFQRCADDDKFHSEQADIVLILTRFLRMMSLNEIKIEDEDQVVLRILARIIFKQIRRSDQMMKLLVDEGLAMIVSDYKLDIFKAILYEVAKYEEKVNMKPQIYQPSPNDLFNYKKFDRIASELSEDSEDYHEMVVRFDSGNNTESEEEILDENLDLA